MPLRNIFWNGLYRAQKTKRAEVRMRIQAHYKRERMEKKGVTIADVRYVSLYLTHPFY
jgi:hypothetical protein